MKSIMAEPIRKGGELVQPRKPKVLIVDDEENNLLLMSAMLKQNGFVCETAAGGTEALDRAVKNPPDLIYLDIMMPGMDGYEVCRRLKENETTRRIPIVMVTALAYRESKIKGLEAGAADFLVKPVDKVELLVRTRNLLMLKEFEDILVHNNLILDWEVQRRTTQVEGMIHELGKSVTMLRESRSKLTGGYLETVSRVALVASFHDEESAAHKERIGRFCESIARRLGLSEEEVDAVRLAASLHDVGKVGIPQEILLKAGPLTGDDYARIKAHTGIGAGILAGSASAIINAAERIAGSHHENWDGSGYPQGIAGDAIPVEGRIVRLADVYDTLRRKRPYKPARSHDEAVVAVTAGDAKTLPSHFDPQILRIFRDDHGHFEGIYESVKEE